MPNRYVPLLRARAGEAIALSQLLDSVKDRVFPVIHLPVAVTPRVLARIGQAWAGRSLAVDGLFNFNATGSPAATTSAIATLASAGVTVVPSLEFNSPATYAQALTPFTHSGLVVKARIGDLNAVPPWLAGAGWQPSQVDLVVMAGHIADLGPGVLDPVLLHTLPTLPHAQAWRSVTLAGSAAPKDFSNLALGASQVSRLDWQLWQAINPHLPYQLDYGDFGVAHPDLTDPPGYVMGRATVSVRYTTTNDWLLIKGRPVSGVNGIPMATQYYSHAQALVGASGFGGLAGCAADSRIQAIAGATTTSGSRQTWVEIAVNRHLCLVVSQLP